MLIQRQMGKKLLEIAKQFPVVGVVGPRQSGKTTLVKEIFSAYQYVTLEDIDVRTQAQDDPRKFFATYGQGEGLIIDEIQHVPDLLSYMQGIVDKSKKAGFFVVTGSQNILIHEKITQTLAGRIALLTLLPLTVSELADAKLLPATVEPVLWQGFYPRIYEKPIDSNLWYSSYVATYVERDVRQLIQIGDVVLFQKFIRLCAARTGKLLNYAELARDAEISPNTAKAWISILETSYIIKLVQPYYKNFDKRVIKSPKLYFYDTGLACYLLGIKESQDLFLDSMRSHLFESFVIIELYKYLYNLVETPQIYFWRDMQGLEVDCIVELSHKKIIPIEIKSGMTVQRGYFSTLLEWDEIAQRVEDSLYVVYAGAENQHRTHGQVIAWDNIEQILKENK